MERRRKGEEEKEKKSDKEWRNKKVKWRRLKRG